MATTITVGIIGLGRVGASVGLALKRYNARKDARQQFAITGYASDNAEAQTAKTLNAVDHTARSIVAAASDKDVVVLALPYREVQGAYQLIGGDLRAGAVLIDTSPLKLPSQEWAAKYLNPEAHMIGVTPVLNPQYLFDGLDDTDHASADLFDGGALLLLPTASADADAVELASDFAELLGMSPQFGDPVEHDVWIASMEGLPVVLGLSAFYTLHRRDGWNDARRAGNPSFGRLTHHLYDQHPDDLRDLLLNNRDNLVRQIDATVEALDALRGLLATGDRAALEEVLIDTMDTYALWVAQRREGRWDKPSSDQFKVSKSDLLVNGMLGGFLSKRMKGDQGGDKE